MNISNLNSSELAVARPEQGSAGMETDVVLSPPQRLAMEWITNGGTLTDAAQYAGVSRQTIYRWLNDDVDFRMAYDLWRSNVLDITEGQVLGMGELAVSTLVDAIRDRKDLKAAQFVLKQIFSLRRHK